MTLQHAERARLTRRIFFALLLAGIFCLIAPAAPSAMAQNFSRRDIEGIVIDGQSQPVIGATVFLEDLKSKNIRSFTSIDGGHFSFAQVGMVDDYQIWAQKGKARSKVRGISSFDSRTDLHFELKLK